MKFVYSEKYEAISTIIDSDFFKDLIIYLKKAPQPPILRELKQVFPIKNFERQLDVLIELELIKRCERRYTVNFPVYHAADQGRVSADYEVFLACFAEMEELAQAELFAGFCMTSEPAYFFAIEAAVQLARVDQVENQELHFISVSEEESSQTIGGFFHANQKLAELHVFEKLNRLIGDIDSEYYLDQVSILLERIRKGRKVRKNIFLDSLFEFEILCDYEAPKIMIPVVSGEVLAEIEIPQSLKKITGFEKRCLITQMAQLLFAGNPTVLVEK